MNWTIEQDLRRDETRVIRAPRGTEKSCKSWLTEAAYRMIQNNLDPVLQRDDNNVLKQYRSSCSIF